MTHQLRSRDIIALGFMTFALFVGAGNIIFPPMVGLQAGEHVWTAAFGFLITAVGLPVLTVVALAKVGGGVDSLMGNTLYGLPAPVVAVTPGREAAAVSAQDRHRRRVLQRSARRLNAKANGNAGK